MAGVPVKLTWWSGGSSWLAAVNGGVGSSACMVRAAVVARAQLEERVNSTVLPRPWRAGRRAPGALNTSNHGGWGKAEAVALRLGAVRQRRAPVGFILG